MFLCSDDSCRYQTLQRKPRKNVNILLLSNTFTFNQNSVSLLKTECSLTNNENCSIDKTSVVNNNDKYTYLNLEFCGE